MVSDPFDMAKGPVLVILTKPNGFAFLIKSSISLLVLTICAIKDCEVLSKNSTLKSIQIFSACFNFSESVTNFIKANYLKIEFSSILKSATL